MHENLKHNKLNLKFKIISQNQKKVRFQLDNDENNSQISQKIQEYEQLILDKSLKQFEQKSLKFRRSLTKKTQNQSQNNDDKQKNRILKQLDINRNRNKISFQPNKSGYRKPFSEFKIKHKQNNYLSPKNFKNSKFLMIQKNQSKNQTQDNSTNEILNDQYQEEKSTIKQNNITIDDIDIKNIKSARKESLNQNILIKQQFHNNTNDSFNKLEKTMKYLQINNKIGKIIKNSKKQFNLTNCFNSNEKIYIQNQIRKQSPNLLKYNRYYYENSNKHQFTRDKISSYQNSINLQIPLQAEVFSKNKHLPYQFTQLAQKLKQNNLQKNEKNLLNNSQKMNKYQIINILINIFNYLDVQNKGELSRYNCQVNNCPQPYKTILAPLYSYITNANKKMNIAKFISESYQLLLQNQIPKASNISTHKNKLKLDLLNVNNSYLINQSLESKNSIIVNKYKIQPQKQLLNRYYKKNINLGYQLDEIKKLDYLNNRLEKHILISKQKSSTQKSYIKNTSYN